MTSFFEIYSNGLFLILGFMTLIWLLSVYLKNAGIVDIFWGIGFIILTGYYLLVENEISWRGWLISLLVLLWGLRLSIHIFARNYGKPEDIRYQNFRKNYGGKHYWWVSFFQVFMLQGILLWMVSAPILGTMHHPASTRFGFIDLLGLLFWFTGMYFEVAGDRQLNKFRKNPDNKGKIFDDGLRRYTRYPQYFGESLIWWGYGLLALASGNIFTLISPIIMTWLLYFVSGVKMMERYQSTKPGFDEYKNRTNAFFPWFPKK